MKFAPRIRLFNRRLIRYSIYLTLNFALQAVASSSSLFSMPPCALQSAMAQSNAYNDELMEKVPDDLKTQMTFFRKVEWAATETAEKQALLDGIAYYQVQPVTAQNTLNLATLLERLAMLNEKQGNLLEAKILYRRLKGLGKTGFLTYLPPGYFASQLDALKTRMASASNNKRAGTSKDQIKHVPMTVSGAAKTSG